MIADLRKQLETIIAEKLELNISGKIAPQIIDRVEKEIAVQTAKLALSYCSAKRLRRIYNELLSGRTGPRKKRSGPKVAAVKDGATGGVSGSASAAGGQSGEASAFVTSQGAIL